MRLERLEVETRRAVLTTWAKQLGVTETDNKSIAKLKEEITMASIKAPARPGTAAPVKPAAAPAKPGPAPAKPAAAAAPAKPAAAPAKPAGAPTPAAKPAAAPVKAATNGVTGPAKPAMPAAAKPAAAPAGEYATKADFEAFKKEFFSWQATAIATLTEQNKRIVTMELIMAGYGEHVTLDEDGGVSLDLDNAPAETIRDWAYQFNACEHTGDVEAIRAHLKGMRTKKGFTGWVPVNDLPRPDAEEAAVEAAEPEEEEITEESINAMNGTALAELANRLGLDKTGTPKVLRNRILAALTEPAAEEPAAEEAAAEGGDEPTLEEGTALSVTHPETGAVAAATFVGYDADGDFVVECPDFGGQVALTAEFVAFA
jgi:hypothetical protein